MGVVAYAFGLVQPVRCMVGDGALLQDPLGICGGGELRDQEKQAASEGFQRHKVIRCLKRRCAMSRFCHFSFDRLDHDGVAMNFAMNFAINSAIRALHNHDGGEHEDNSERLNWMQRFS